MRYFQGELLDHFWGSGDVRRVRRNVEKRLLAMSKTISKDVDDMLKNDPEYSARFARFEKDVQAEAEAEFKDLPPVDRSAKIEDYTKAKIADEKHRIAGIVEDVTRPQLVARGIEKGPSDKANELAGLLINQGMDVAQRAATARVALPKGLAWSSVLIDMPESQIWLMSLALLISFVGVTNAMFLSVSERYREIGTMKCLGALDGFIVKLFFLESTFQGIVGTAAGILVGLVLAVGYESVALGPRFALPFFPVVAILVCAGLSFVIGTVLSIAGAILPAVRAAHMQPVEAMRIEE
jgi:hypothetical protein